MINIDDIFFSFESSEIKGFEKITELAQKQSFFPEGWDNDGLLDLDSNHSLGKLKKSLDFPPVEEAMLQLESNHAAVKYRKRIRRLLLQNTKQESEHENDRCIERKNNLKSELKEGLVSLDRGYLKELKKEVSTYFEQKCPIKGNFFYPRGGFRSWHTNKYDTPGWRMYVVNVDKPNQSFFRFKHPKNNKICTYWEKSNCTVNFFCIEPENVLWHCIGSPNANRWSKGFRVPNTWMKKVF